MAQPSRRSPHHGLTASESDELLDATRSPERISLPVIDRYQQVATEYAARCVRALTDNDLRGAMRAATISRAAQDTIAAEQRYQEWARETRERWERDETLTHPTPRVVRSIAR